MRLDHLHRQKSCLVAHHGQMGGKLCQRMRQMPTKQNAHASNHSPTVQNRCSPLSSTIQGSSHGPDHSTPQQQQTQCHPYYCRPWLHQSSTVPTLHHEHDRRRNHQTLSRQCVPMVWNPLQDHIRPRPSIHITFLNRTMPTPQNQPKHIHSLSPPNRRPFRTKEPMGRTIPTTSDQCLPRRLE